MSNSELLEHLHFTLDQIEDYYVHHEGDEDSIPEEVQDQIDTVLSIISACEDTNFRYAMIKAILTRLSQYFRLWRMDKMSLWTDEGLDRHLSFVKDMKIMGVWDFKAPNWLTFSHDEY